MFTEGQRRSQLSQSVVALIRCDVLQLFSQLQLFSKILRCGWMWAFFMHVITTRLDDLYCS